jgi:hypothetical protein
MSTSTTRPFIEGQMGLREGVEQFLVDAHELPDLSIDERIDVIERAVSFLAEMLLPHARAHERIVCPELDRVFGTHGSGSYVAQDRAMIQKRIEDLSYADPRDVGRIQEILYALHLLVTGTLTREDEAFLRLIRAEPAEHVELLLEQVDGYEQAFGR